MAGRMTASIASWDFDVPREWFKIPLDEDLDARRWAEEFAHEAAEFLGAEGPVDTSWTGSWMCRASFPGVGTRG